MHNEHQKRCALALMAVVLELSPVIYEALGKIYRKFQVGGWFFGARKLSGDLAKQSRYEVVSYLTALGAILLEGLPSSTEEAWKIIDILEENIFTMKL